MSTASDAPGPPTGPEPGPVRLPDLQAFELLLAVAETGSLGQAAARLSISQPTASERMRTMERRLGLRLLDRTTRGSRLTPAGLAVTGWARSLLAQARLMTEGITALRSQQAGNLRVTASLTLAEHLLPGWLIALQRIRPAVHVGLHVANSHQVIEALRHGEADLGFVEGPFVPGDLRHTAVGWDRLVVVTAPNHPWAHRSAPVTGAELASTPLLLREAGSGTRETLERALRSWDGVSVPLLELGATAPLRSAALRGAGPAVLSELAVADDLARGRLIEIPVTGDLPFARTLRAVWPDGRELPPAAQDLLRIASGGDPGPSAG